MLGKIRIMIVEDNPQLAESISSYLETQEDLQVVGIAYNADEAIEQLGTLLPDTIILDLVMPQSDGFVLLNHLRTVQYEKRPQVIVLSAVSSDAIIKRACDEGAVYYIAKPFTMAVLLERIRDLSTSQPKSPMRPSFKPSEKATLDERISTVLMSIGIPSHLKGYRYLIQGVKMLNDNPDLISNITKQVYPGIGLVFNTTAGNVERSIRTVIDTAISSGRLERLNELFGYEVYSPDKNITCAALMSLVTNRVSS